jgi:hypothetical protein
MAVYDSKGMTLGDKPGSLCFLYDSNEYAQFLAQHFCMVLSDPVFRLKFDTDLAGYGWDLKQLISARERIGLLLDDTYMSDVYEIYGLSFSSAKGQLSFQGQWAGYLLFPNGSTAKRWAFCDAAYVDADSDGNEYNCW